MKLTIWNAAVLGLMTLAPGRADTVTKTDHTSVNGVLTKMAQGTVTLEARYASGKKTLMISMGMVESIEFNSIAFNPGAPPKAYGVGPGLFPVESAPVKQPVAADAIELRGSGGERQPCKVVSIDEGVVYCEAVAGAKDKGKPAEYPRKIVLRIMVGGGR